MDPALVPNPPQPPDQQNASEAFLSNGQRVLIQIVPLTTAEGKFLVEVGSLYGPIEQVLKGLWLTFALGLPVMVAVAVAGGYFLMRRVLAQVDEITIQAEHISSRNLSERFHCTRDRRRTRAVDTRPQSNDGAPRGRISAHQPVLGRRFT